MNARIFRRQRFCALSLFAIAFVMLASSCRDNSAGTRGSQKDLQNLVQRPASAPVQAETEKSCRDFVQDFYDWYFDKLNAAAGKPNSGSTVDDVLRRRPRVLTEKLDRLLRDDETAAARSPGEIVGLDFDPFINAQDWDGKYFVKRVDVTGGDCRASVWGLDSGHQLEIVEPELEMQDGKWVFVNFHYSRNTSPDNENLIDLLISLDKERKHFKQGKRH
jgi:hypothetical protein